jgi:crotonobetainyl-CoA:carnitine CoA-transferase CaiB-like acyl-CoA transferase
VLGPDSLDVLAGTTVVDFGMWRPVPFAGQLLGELGATVTKVERPGGDPMRSFPGLYRRLNDMKDVVELDLARAGDRERALELGAGADVVMEGFRPGVAERLGIGYAAVGKRNPHVVYCSVSGYGQTGGLASVPGHDVNYQAWSGVLAARLPDAESKLGIPLGDLAGGAYAAMAVCAALVARARDGRGRCIDVSMTDVLRTWADPPLGTETADRPRGADGFPAYGVFACADGHVTLGIVNEQRFWEGLCRALELDDVRDLETTARAARGPELRARLAAAMAQQPRDEIVDLLLGEGVPVAPVLRWDEATVGDAAVREADGFVRLKHPVRYRTYSSNDEA